MVRRNRNTGPQAGLLFWDRVRSSLTLYTLATPRFLKIYLSTSAPLSIYLPNYD